MFSPPGSGAARGVSILIAKRIPFTPSAIRADDDGPYLVLLGTLQNEKWWLTFMHPIQVRTSFPPQYPVSSVCQ